MKGSTNYHLQCSLCQCTLTGRLILVCWLAAVRYHIYRRWPPHHLVDHCYTRCCHRITAAAAPQHNPSLPESDCHPLRPAQPVRPGHCYCSCGPCFTRHATATRSGSPENLRACCSANPSAFANFNVSPRAQHAYSCSLDLLCKRQPDATGSCSSSRGHRG